VWNKAAGGQLYIVNSKRDQGETMRKWYVAISVALMCVITLGLTAQAQDEDTVVANVPYDFVASGAVLPAGTYRISRVDTGGIRELEISSYETGASALLLPTVFADAPGEHAHLTLRLVGGKYFLSGIQTANGVYTLALPRSVVMMAQTGQHGGMSSSGSN
jgi:hypothetical protein